jgi:RNA polymerase sigma-70 factor (ECF subfamily)
MEELIQLYHQGLYRYAFRLTGQTADAEDLVQETFLHASNKLRSLRDSQAARPWLFSILRNRHLMTVRKRSHGQESLNDLPEWPAPAATDRSHHDPERLQQLLLEMPESYRTPLILFYLEDFSYRDISEQMAIPIGTVMSRLARAKDWLRSRYHPIEDPKVLAPGHVENSPHVL